MARGKCPDTGKTIYTDRRDARVALGELAKRRPRVGCGLANFQDRMIAPLFGAASANCSFAEQWRPYIEDVRL